MPHNRARWGLNLLPLVAEQQIEIAIVPLRWIARPRAFKTTGGCVSALSRAVGVALAEAHLLQWRALGFGFDGVFWAGTMAFAKGVTAGH